MMTETNRRHLTVAQPAAGKAEIRLKGEQRSQKPALRVASAGRAQEGIGLHIEKSNSKADVIAEVAFAAAREAGVKSSGQADAAVTSDAAHSTAQAPSAEEFLRVGDLARRTGKTVRALHLYEDLGLLTPHERSGPGRYRQYNADAPARVRWITKLQSLGLSLSEIQGISRAHAGVNTAQFAAEKLREIYVEKLQETQTKLKELQALEAELEESLRFLGDCHSVCEPDAEVASCGCCERHPESVGTPELVAGARGS